MDQVNPEGEVLPSANVTPPAPAQNTADEPKVETPAESQPAPVDEQPEAKKGVGKRIDELTRLRRDAERDRDHWRELAMRLQQPQQQTAQATDDEQPKSFKDFGYDEQKYNDYLQKRADARAEKSAKEVAERYRKEAEAIARRAKFDERIEAFAKTVSDYHEVVGESTPISEAMADAIMDSEEAGALMYYLGENPDVARKLYYLSPAKAGRELQKLEDRLVAERKKAAEKPVSKAPPPAPKIDAVDPAPRVSSTSDPESDKLSDKEWFALAEKERLKKRKGE